MASQQISSGLEKLQSTLDGSVEGAKVADLKRDTKDYHDPKNRLTTDYGVKQENTGMFDHARLQAMNANA